MIPSVTLRRLSLIFSLLWTRCTRLPYDPFPHRTTTEIHNVRRRDRLGGLIHEYQQVA